MEYWALHQGINKEYTRLLSGYQRKVLRGSYSFSYTFLTSEKYIKYRPNEKKVL
jgi:hypothetical protein